MPMENNQSKPKEPLGSFILKILFIGVLVIIGAIVLFGFVFQEFDPINFLINIVGILLMIGLLGLAVKGLVSFIKPKPFSPQEDFKTSLIRLSIKSKPFNVKDLHLRGEDMRTSARWGKIKGLSFLPYLTSQPMRDKFGKTVYERDVLTNDIVYEKKWSKGHNGYIDVPKPKYELITEKDGDVIIITDKFSFPLSIFSRGVDIVRAHKSYVSDLLGDIYIKDVNLVAYGDYLYPSKQWQNDISKIMKENEAQTIIATHRNNLDLVSTVTQMSLGADPTFQKIMLAQSERLTSGFSGQGGQ